MSHSDGGKGDSPRKQQDQKAYGEGWDRIFRQRPSEKALEEEPLKDDEHDD